MMAGQAANHPSARSLGDPMTRTTLLIAGIVCWTVAGADAAAHLIGGDLVVPAAMTAVFVVWVGLRRLQMTRRRVALAA